MFGLEANEKANGGDGHGTDFKTETGKAWMGGLAGDTKDKEKEKEATTAAKKEEGKSDEAEKAGASDDKGDKNVDEAGGAVDDGLLGVGAEDDEGEPAGGDGPAPSGEGGEAPEKSGEEGGVLGLGEGDAVSVADGNVGEGEDGDLSKARAIAIMESAIFAMAASIEFLSGEEKEHVLQQKRELEEAVKSLKIGNQPAPPLTGVWAQHGFKYGSDDPLLNQKDPMNSTAEGKQRLGTQIASMQQTVGLVETGEALPSQTSDVFADRATFDENIRNLRRVRRQLEADAEGRDMEEAAYEHEDQPLDLGLDFNDDSTRKGSLGELRRIRRQVRMLFGGLLRQVDTMKESFAHLKLPDPDEPLPEETRRANAIPPSMLEHGVMSRPPPPPPGTIEAQPTMAAPPQPPGNQITYSPPHPASVHTYSPPPHSAHPHPPPHVPYYPPGGTLGPLQTPPGAPSRKRQQASTRMPSAGPQPTHAAAMHEYPHPYPPPTLHAPHYPQQPPAQTAPYPFQPHPPPAMAPQPPYQNTRAGWAGTAVAAAGTHARPADMLDKLDLSYGVGFRARPAWEGGGGAYPTNRQTAYGYPPPAAYGTVQPYQTHVPQDVYPQPPLGPSRTGQIVGAVPQPSSSQKTRTRAREVAEMERKRQMG